MGNKEKQTLWWKAGLCHLVSTKGTFEMHWLISTTEESTWTREAKLSQSKEKRMNRALKTYFCTIFMVILITLPSHVLAQQKIKDPFVGTWKLISVETKKSSGEVVPGPLGKDAVGILMYDSKGFMSAQAMRPDRPNVASRDTENIMRAFNGYVAYCGRYTVNENEGTITHHITVSLMPDWIGDQKRFFEFWGRRLILKTLPIIYGGESEPMENRVIWERID